MAPPSKRPRQSNACRLCLSCKTRCDDITQLGCRRCREKKRLCSLIDPEVKHSTDNEDAESDAKIEIVSTTVKDLEKRIESLTELVASQRAWSTTATIGGAPTASGSSLTPSHAVTLPVPSFSPALLPNVPIHSALASGAPIPNVHRILHAPTWDEARNSTYDISDFPDVRTTHAITTEQLENAYMMWVCSLLLELTVDVCEESAFNDASPRYSTFPRIATYQKATKQTNIPY